MSGKRNLQKKNNSVKLLIMEKEFYLDDEYRGTLEEFHRACLDKKTADGTGIYL
jgi:hypothetical protein